MALTCKEGTLERNESRYMYYLKEAADLRQQDAQEELATAYNSGTTKPSRDCDAEEGDPCNPVSEFNLSLALYRLGLDRFDERIMAIPGHSPIPKSLFWSRRALKGDLTVETNDLVIKKEAGSSPLKRCIRCLGAWYCGKESQVQHWKAGHKNLIASRVNEDDIKSYKIYINSGLCLCLVSDAYHIASSAASLNFHPSNVLSEILAWCCHPVVSGAMFGANGELLSLSDESVFKGFQLGSFLTTPSVSHETLSAILARNMKKGRRLKVHWPRGIVTGVLFVPHGNEEDRKSAWRAVRRSEKVSYRMRDSAEIAFERLVRVYDDFKERCPHAFQDTSEYEKELNAIKSFTGAAFGALGSDVFHLEMRLRCDLMPNRGLTAPSRKRVLSEEPELEEEQQPPVKKMRYSQVAVAAAAAPSRKRGLPEDEETGLDEQPQVKKSRSNSSAIPPKKRSQFSTAAPQSILRQASQQRANDRSVQISETCTARPFDKTQAPQSVSECGEDVVQEIPVLICKRRRNLRWIPSAPLRKKPVASVLELEACDLSARFDEPDDVVPEKKEEEAAVDLARVEADARPPVEVVAMEEPNDFDQPDVVVEEEEEEEVISSLKVHRRHKSREAASLISELGKYWEVPCSSRRGSRVRRQPVGGKS
eukprot:scaffold14255_cov141-Skeletonema_dohrnii-CCMP3373.AAC.1